MIAAKKEVSPADQQEDPTFKLRKNQETAKELLDRAHEILREADESYIASNSGPRRAYPTFGKSEVKIGPLLGLGGYGQVFEVENFLLGESDQVHCDIVEAHVEVNEATSTLQANEDKSDDASNCGTKSNENFVLSDDENHYDIINARMTMSQLVRRNGSARYAIKRLHDDLNELERARGMIDLALEAKYLSVLWHPNIGTFFCSRFLTLIMTSDVFLNPVKMRAIASGSSLEPNFFIIMDRLYEILDHRFETWISTKQRNKGGLFGRGANRDRLHDLLIERLTVAYDIAAALCYMHEHRLVYRDLKKENLGTVYVSQPVSYSSQSASQFLF